MGTPNAMQFRAKASSSDAFEVLSSKIALTHATNPDLKAFAQMMIDDHTKSTDRLVALGGIRQASLAHTQNTDRLVALGGISKASLEAKMKPGADGKFAGNDLIDTDHANELNSLDSK